MPVRFLVIAPELGLKFGQAETQRIINSGLSVHLLQGDVSPLAVIDAFLTPGLQFEGVWIVSHGNEHGILLSGNQLLQTSALTAMIRSKGVRYAVINTCSSASIAQQINAESGAGVVATIASVPDEEAFTTGALMAQALVKTGDFVRAFNLAKPGNNTRYFQLPPIRRDREIMPNRNDAEYDDMPMGGSSRIEYQLSQLIASNRELVKSNHDMDKRLAILELSVSDNKARIGSMTDTFMDRLEKMDERSNGLTTIHRSGETSVVVGRVYILGVTALVFLLLFATFALMYKISGL